MVSGGRNVPVWARASATRRAKRVPNTGPRGSIYLLPTAIGRPAFLCITKHHGIPYRTQNGAGAFNSFQNGSGPSCQLSPICPRPSVGEAGCAY